MSVPVDTVTPESSPETIATWDSLNHMGLVLALEQEFHVSLNDDQIVELMSVKQIVALFEKVARNA